MLGSLPASPVLAQLAIESPNADVETRLGRSVAGVGDVNGDGTPDVLAGAKEGAYLFSGAGGSLIHSLSPPNLEPDGSFGTAVAGVGDIDGDGTPDVLVSAQSESESVEPGPGRAYLFSGTDGSIIDTLTSPNAESDGRFGSAVAGLGDVNGDGIPDVVVGAERETVNGKTRAGRAYVFSGEDGSVLHTLISPDPQEFGGFANDVASLGDVTGDGSPDVIVGAALEDTGSSADDGRVYLFSGADGTAVRTFASPNPELSGTFGMHVTDVGDVNGDGLPDILVGAPNEEAPSDPTSAGRAYLLSGAEGGLLLTLTSPNPEELGFFGVVGTLGDVNGDGIPDVTVGATGETVDGINSAGRTYVMSGADGSVIGTLTSPNPDSEGVAEEGRFGQSVASAGDLDGDGTPDAIIGAPLEVGGGTLQAGRVYLFRSNSGELPVELASFQGRQTRGSAVELTWTTASEQNNAGFRIQHRRKGSWKKIGFVDGHGTTTDALSYRYVTDDLPVGSHQFRLTQVDLDGTTTVHDPVTVEVGMNEALRLHAPAPNPVRNEATISFAVQEAQEVTITIYNTLGQHVGTVYRGTPTAGETTTASLEVGDLSSGVYFLRLQADGTTHTEKMTIMR